MQLDHIFFVFVCHCLGHSKTKNLVPQLLKKKKSTIVDLPVK